MPTNGNDEEDQYTAKSDGENGRVEWQLVQNRFTQAMESSDDLRHQVDRDGIVHTSDRNFGYMAQRALECAYKSVLASHGIEYPANGPDGHDLRQLVELMREQFGAPVPGERHSYLSEFGGGPPEAAWTPTLDKPTLAREIPDVVREIIALKREPPDQAG